MTERLETEIADAVEAVRLGMVVGMPTDTVYGIGADPRRPGAAQRIFAAKGRPETLALPVLVPEPEDAGRLACLDETSEALIARYWPGPLTLVLPRRPGLDLYLGGDPASVGLRCPAHATTRQLLARTGPLAVTSANRHGEPPATTAADLRAELGADVAVVVDGGTCDGAPSSVLTLVGGAPRLVREGAIPALELLAAVEGLRA